jgi:hypothetical protein
VVRELAGYVRLVALALLGFALISWAVKTMWRGDVTDWGRLILGTALCLGNLVWWQWGIDLNNAINRVIAAPEVGSLIRPHLEVPELTSDPTQAFAPALTVIAAGVVYILLTLTMFLRILTIDILIAIGPLGLFCKTGEATDRFYETYVGWATGTLFSQVMVVIALKLANVFGSVTSGVVGTLMSLGVLWLAMKMPGVLGQKFSQSGSGGGIAQKLYYLRRMIGR